MSLNIKGMDDIFNNLVDWITAKTDKITDFNVGSAIRTLLEAISVQFEIFYFDMKQNILFAIENSVYNSFGFELKISTVATGYVTVTFEEPLPDALTFPEGTVFCTSAEYGYIYYESTKEYTAPAGSVSVLIPIQCKSEGTVGNVPAGAITSIVTSNSIIESVSNETSLNNGTDAESSAERKKRFQNFIKTLARGTVDAIIYGALEVTGVAGAWVDDNYIGYVKLYVHDSNGDLPEELRQKVLSNVTNYRAAGIEVEVLPIVKHPVDLSLEVIIDNDYDTNSYESLIQSLVVSTLNDYSVSASMYISDIIHTIKNVYDDIVINIIVKTGEDIHIDSNELVRAGNVTVTCTNLRNWRS